MDQTKISILLLISIITFFNFEFINCFSECANSNLGDPLIPGITNCPIWLAYAQTQGVNIQQWCKNPSNFQKCCLTCQNYNLLSNCRDYAYISDCQIKAQLNMCNTTLSNSLPISFYCPRSCGICPSTLSCNTLLNNCNGGKCSTVAYFSVPSIRCECPSGRGGAYCQQVDACLSKPCLNGGSCVMLYETDLYYSCQCAPGCNGRNCESCNPCDNLKCNNGGVCLADQFGNPYCNCPVDFTGDTCQNYLGACYTNPCKNGGTCIPNQKTGGFICICIGNYMGYICQYEITPSICYAGDLMPSSCSDWYAKGFCSFNYALNVNNELKPVPLLCPVSCKLCSRYCMDSREDCILFARLGLCNSINSINNDICQQSCGTCLLNRSN